MNRRSFISRLAGAAAIISLAPRLAFRAPDITIAPEWGNTLGGLTQQEIIQGCLAAFEPVCAQLRDAADNWPRGEYSPGQLSNGSCPR